MTMMQHQREHEAMTAYLNLLARKGVDQSGLQRREACLEKLTELIATIDCDGMAYREAVEAMLDNIERREWPFYVTVAREYFHFWVKDFKYIAAFTKDAGFDIDPLAWMPPDEDIKTLWARADSATFETTENWSMKAYTLALRQEGAEQTVVDTRIKLVKLLLLRLRDAPDKTCKCYRVAVDATIPLFAKQETRRLFFCVVREFYYFWIGDPDAASHIALPAKATSYV
jgi:hypothetical protein